MKKLLVASTSIICAAIAGVLTIGFSPVVCSCVPAHVEYPRYAELPAGNYELSPELLQAGLWQSLKDQELTFGQGPLNEKFGCVKSEPHIVDCHLVSESSLLLKRGHDFEYVFNSGGGLRSIRVKEFTEFAP